MDENNCICCDKMADYDYNVCKLINDKTSEDNINNNTSICNKTNDDMSICNKTNDNATICNKIIDNATVCNKTNDNATICNKTNDNATICNKTNDNATICNKIIDNATICNKIIDNATICNKTPNSIQSFDYVVYHKYCLDGELSAHISKIQKCCEKAKYIPCSAGSSPKGDFVDKTILFLDVCPIRKMLEILSKIAKHIVILDHHEPTNNANYPFDNNNVAIVYDKDRAGCQITWDYFANGVDYPWLIKYVADKDLGKWKLPYSREINSYLKYNNIISSCNFNEINRLMLFYNEHNLKEFIAIGSDYVKFDDRLIDLHIERSKKAKFKVKIQDKDVCYNIWIVECSIKDIDTDLGAKLAKLNLDEDFVVVYSHDAFHNKFKFSLRGKDESNINLSEISEKFGGGGHEKASGFKLDCNEFNNVITFG